MAYLPRRKLSPLAVSRGLSGMDLLVRLIGLVKDDTKENSKRNDWIGSLYAWCIWVGRLRNGNIRCGLANGGVGV
jgi:hypothetical protein